MVCIIYEMPLVVAFRSFLKTVERGAVDITLVKIMGADAARGPRVICLCYIKNIKKAFWLEIRCINNAEIPHSCAAQFRLELSSKFSQRLCCLFVKSMFYISDLFPARSDPLLLAVFTVAGQRMARGIEIKALFNVCLFVLCEDARLWTEFLR